MQIQFLCFDKARKRFVCRANVSKEHQKIIESTFRDITTKYTMKRLINKMRQLEVELLEDLSKLSKVSDKPIKEVYFEIIEFYDEPMKRSKINKVNKNTFIYAGIMSIGMASIGGYLAVQGCSTILEATIILIIGALGVGIGGTLLFLQILKIEKKTKKR